MPIWKLAHILLLLLLLAARRTLEQVLTWMQKAAQAQPQEEPLI
jgi:hypothetical protein